MPDSLAEHAQKIRAELGQLWTRVNEATDNPDAQPAPEEREALLRELAELARLPFDIAESLGGGPNESLSVAAVNARAFLLRVVELGPDVAARPSRPGEPVPLPRL